MRKWMRDRLKRPKKNTEGGKSEPAQAPLQPAYYDAAEAPASVTPKSAEPENAEPEIEARQAPDPQPDRGEAAEASFVPPRTARPDGNSDPRRRRRRGRGGRGRSGAQAARTAPVAEVSRDSEAENGQAVAAPAIEAPGAALAMPTAMPRASKGTVVLAIGLPGSGKSSWFNRHK